MIGAQRPFVGAVSGQESMSGSSAVQGQMHCLTRNRAAAISRILCAAQVGAEFLAQHYPVHTVLLPNPTWANHNKIFPLAGIKDVRMYRYFKPSTKGLDYEVCNLIHNSPPEP